MAISFEKDSGGVTNGSPRVGAKEFEVTVIVPARDEEKSLPALAAALEAQTLAPNEVVIVDGGSTDRTLEVAREPRIVAWSHIYLGRIFDIQENRTAALVHYRAALSAGDTTPDTRAAAERGIAEPYAPQRRPQD